MLMHNLFNQRERLRMDFKGFLCLFQEARKVVQTWEAEFVKAPNMQKKLCMMYLANDILQNSRKKGPEFVNEFYHTLERPVGHIFKHGDAKVIS